MKKDLLIIYSILLQLITGSFIMFSPIQINVARLGVFYELFHPYWLGGLYMVLATILATVGLFCYSRYRFLFFLPQYFFLLLTAGSAINYIVIQHYADGIMRPWTFILIDQLSVILTTALYIFAVFNFRKEKEDVI